MTKALQRFASLFYNHTERRLRTFWRLLIVLFFASAVLGGGLSFLASLIVVFLLMLIGQIPFSAFGNSQQLGQGFYTALGRLPLLDGLRSLVVLLLVGLAFLLIARWVDRRPWRDYGFHFNRTWWRDLGFGLLLGLVLMGVVFGIECLLGWQSIQATIENGQPGLSFWQLLTDGLIAYVLVGVQEELFFRGFTIKNLAEGLHLPHINSKVAVLIPYLLFSVLFGFAHGINPNATLASSLNLGLIGLLLGLGFILTGNLAIPVGLHIAWNFAEGNVFGFAVSGSNGHMSLLATQQAGPALWTGGALGPEGGLMGLVAALLGMVLIYAWVRWTRRRASVQAEIAQYEPLQRETHEHSNAGRRPLRQLIDIQNSGTAHHG